jgi:hypothetical protein
VRFSAPVQTGNGYWFIPRVKQPVHGVNHPLPSSAEVIETIRAIPLLPLCAFMAGLRVKLATLLHLVPRLRMSGPIPLFLLYAFMAWTGRTFIQYVYCKDTESVTV